MNNNFIEKIQIANVELLEKGNLKIIKDIFSNEYISHHTNKNYKGHSIIQKWSKQIRTAFPDIRIVKLDFYLEEKEKIAWMRTLEGKHLTKMWGLDPSKKKIRWNEMVISKFQGDKIMEEWVVSELKGEMLVNYSKT